jgi:uncharacterized oxidoreductase
MRVAAGRLEALCFEVCRRGGSSEDESRQVARHLVAANLAGHDSHGVGVLPVYVDSLIEGSLVPGRHLSVAADHGPVLTLDGNRGWGAVVGAEAMTLAIARAKALGVAVAALRQCHHLGRIGAWGEQCAAAGMVSIHYVNATGYRPLVAPFGARAARYTTNPYCTAIPATGSNPPIILDMATSAVAFGKIRVAHNRNEPAPEDALIDPQGRPTRDAGVMFADPRGALRPFGKHKGYGLGLVCELLAGALTNGGGMLPEHFEGTVITNNMLTIVLDPAAIGDSGWFRDEVDAITAHMKGAPPADGVEAVMVPGDPERKARAEREANGVPVDAETWAQIVAAAGKLGLGADEVERIISA